MRRLIPWGSALLFTGALYALATFGPNIQAALVARLGAGAYGLIPAPFLVAATLLLLHTVRRRPGQTLSTLAAFALFAGLYAGCLRLLERPVEQIHFLLYGGLGGVVFWALSRHIVGWVLYPWTLAVVYLVGMGDELIQWWLPNRVADFHDVLFDALGGALGLALVALGVRPRAARGPLRPRQAQYMTGGIIVVAIATGGFLTSVHEFGYAIRDPEIGTFLTLFTAEEFRALNGARLAATADLASRDPRLRRFDVEARRHLRLEERHLKEGQLAEAASERAIVHHYYAAYLKVPGRLPDPALPLDTLRRSPTAFQSEAYQGKIFTWFGQRAVWLAVAAFVFGGAGMMLVFARALPPPDLSPARWIARRASSRHAVAARRAP